MNISQQSIQAVMTNGSLQMKEKVFEPSLECVQYTLTRMECVMEALTEEGKAPIGKIPHGLKTRS